MEPVPQSYRYAPLSSGLDIVRKTFGKYELALIQTTHVDRERVARAFDHDDSAFLG